MITLPMIKINSQYNSLIQIVCICIWLTTCGLFILPGCTQETTTIIDFSYDSAESNSIDLFGAGFDSLPISDYQFGSIPTGNAFHGATDGRGMIINAKPGHGIMVFGPIIESDKSAIIRCSIRAQEDHVSAILASVDQNSNEFVNTFTCKGTYFKNRYKRLTGLFLPGPSSFRPLVQIVNTSNSENLTVYIDNFTVILLEPDHYYHSDFINGEENDPDVISFHVDEVLPTPTPTYIPTPMPTPTPEPSIIPSATLVVPLGNYPLELVKIKAGSFQMGSPDTEENREADEQLHPVTIERDFWIGKYEVTNAQYKQFVETHSSSNYRGVPLDADDQPVVFVSWREAKEYCDWLTQEIEGLMFRLPTEREWEYVCRAGSTGSRYWSNLLENASPCFYENLKDESTQTIFEWENIFSCNDSSYTTAKVGSYLPNTFLIYDMLGNVSEWCEDYYNDYQIDNSSEDTGNDETRWGKVIRGGSWLHNPLLVRSASRDWGHPEYKNNYIGFRVVAIPSP